MKIVSSLWKGETGKCSAHEEQNPELYAFKQAYLKIVQPLLEDYRFGHITDRSLARELFATEKDFNGPWNTIMYHKNSRKGLIAQWR